MLLRSRRLHLSSEASESLRRAPFGVALPRRHPSLVAPLAAIYPLVTVGLSAMLLKHIDITARIVAGTALTVLGVALVLIG